MLTKYNLKMPHAVYGGENAMDNIAVIIKNLNAKKVAMLLLYFEIRRLIFNVCEAEFASTFFRREIPETP